MPSCRWRPLPLAGITIARMRAQLGSMTTLMLVILAALWFVLLFTGAPIYALMALTGAAFIAAAGINPITSAAEIVKAADSFPLLAAPMYILMGSLMNTSGVTERIFRFATVLRPAGGRRLCRQHSGQRDLRRHERLGSGGRGRHRHHRNQSHGMRATTPRRQRLSPQRPPPSGRSSRRRYR